MVSLLVDSAVRAKISCSPVVFDCMMALRSLMPEARVQVSPCEWEVPWHFSEAPEEHLIVWILLSSSAPCYFMSRGDLVQQGIQEAGETFS